MFILKPSFAAGELSPALYGRTDLNKYDVGAADLTNFIVLRYGGVKRRPGLKYLAGTYSNKKARLIPFSYSVEDSYVIEITAGKFRFYRDGQLLNFTVNNDFVESDLPDIKYTQSADVLFLVHPNHWPMTLTRNSATSWSYESMDLTTRPFEDSVNNTIKMETSDVSGEITLKTDQDYFTSDMVGQWIRLGHTMNSQYVKYDRTIKQIVTTVNIKESSSFTIDVSEAAGMAYQSFKVVENVRGADVTSKFSFNSTTNVLTCTDSNWRSSYTLVGLSLTVTINYTGAADESTNVLVPPQGTIYLETYGFWTGTVELQRYDDDAGIWITVRGQTGNHSSNYNFSETNEGLTTRKYRVFSSDFENSTWSGENAKQKGYVVLQCFATYNYGTVRIDSITNVRQATGTVKARLASKEYTTDFGLQSWSSTKGYPSCIGFFEDRLVFAGTKKYPQSYWLSDTGDYYNFTVSTPQQDSDSISGTLNNGKMNGIKAMVSFGELILLTAGGEYKLSGGNNAMTPSNQQAKAQEYRGINNLTPIVSGSKIVYVQQMGSIIRDLGYQYDQDKYTGDDVSLLASHLFEGHTIVGLAYQQTPNSIVWCVRDDGVLLGMTYIKEQDVYAWHKHTTQGKFIDVCCVAGVNEDRTYFVVQRDNKYYVELMASQIDNENEKTQYYADCYTAADNVATVTGLGRLEGKEVQILADGNVMPEAEVEDGSIALGGTCTKAIVGLGYESVLKTLPIEFNANDGTYQSRKKRLSKLMVYFKASRGGLYGMDPAKLDEIKWRSNENYNQAIALYSGKKYIVPPSTWTDTLQLIVKQPDPLPMSILSIVPEIQAGG